MNELFLCYGWATLVFLVVTYFALGFFIHHLEMRCNIFRIFTTLHVEELFLWPFHVDAFEIWLHKWRNERATRKKMLYFVTLFMAFTCLYAYAVWSLQEVIIAKWLR